MEILSRVYIARSNDSTRKVYPLFSRNSEVWHASCVVGHLDLTDIVVLRDWKAYARGSRPNHSEWDSCFLTLQKQRNTLELVHASTEIHQKKRKVWTEVGLLKCLQIRNSYSSLESESRSLRKTPWHCADECCLIICVVWGYIWCCWVRRRDIGRVRRCRIERRSIWCRIGWVASGVQASSISCSIGGRCILKSASRESRFFQSWSRCINGLDETHIAGDWSPKRICPARDVVDWCKKYNKQYNVFNRGPFWGCTRAQSKLHLEIILN